VHLHRERIARVLLERVPERELEQRLRLQPRPAAGERRLRRFRIRRRQVESGSVRRDRLQTCEAALARRLHLGAESLAELAERRFQGLLGRALDPHDRAHAAAGQLAHPLEADALVYRRIAVVEQQPVRAGRAQQRRGVVLHIRRQPLRVDGFLGRGAVEQHGQVGDGATVREPGRDVRPLPRIRALGEEAAELVERSGRLAKHRVRVVIDEPDAVQYFKKWP
jgi:hypothetical protein